MWPPGTHPLPPQGYITDPLPLRPPLVLSTPAPMGTMAWAPALLPMAPEAPGTSWGTPPACNLSSTWGRSPPATPPLQKPKPKPASLSALLAGLIRAEEIRVPAAEQGGGAGFGL